MFEGLLWGAVAASSLLIGGLLGLARPWPPRAVGLILAFGAGALISAVSFDLAEEGGQLGGFDSVALGLALGALTYYGLDRLVDRPSKDGSGSASGGGALALGALLDGIPEQLVLGIGLAAGGGVSLSLIVAIFVSNLPEAVGGSADLLRDGHPRRRVRAMWLGVAALCTVASVAGYAIADLTSGDVLATIDGFAAGSLLVMLIDSMVPEAARQGGRAAGLVTVLGFAVAAALSGIG